eukprot:CAMPEP_0184691184 /NCGR_PEP_ID=MMETSP0313-20130426/91_1 /TAXON_ID=2792 /ORGANISM="Porphyridium aerugineum, Strain SAG 1380-2" /LENGTH=352 /DNA_ID=CAMNT_0027148853 /DNA_START=101 /DNA_END=1159 /DNA_ORIENTATION=+
MYIHNVSNSFCFTTPTHLLIEQGVERPGCGQCNSVFRCDDFDYISDKVKERQGWTEEAEEIQEQGLVLVDNSWSISHKTQRKRKMEVVLRVSCPLKPSERLAIVGSSDYLGNWKPGDASRLYQVGQFHETIVQVTEDGAHYKFVLYNMDQPGKCKWELGNNRYLKAVGQLAGISSIASMDTELSVENDGEGEGKNKDALPSSESLASMSALTNEDNGIIILDPALFGEWCDFEPGTIDLKTEDRGDFFANSSRANSRLQVGIPGDGASSITASDHDDILEEDEEVVAVVEEEDDKLLLSSASKAMDGYFHNTPGKGGAESSSKFLLAVQISSIIAIVAAIGISFISSRRKSD